MLVAQCLSQSVPNIFFFTELEQKILQLVQKHKRPQIANAILRGGKKKEKKTELEESGSLTSDYIIGLQ